MSFEHGTPYTKHDSNSLQVLVAMDAISTDLVHTLVRIWSSLRYIQLQLAASRLLW